MITRRLAAVLDDRLRLASPARRASTKVFPDHWSFMFGEIALYALVTLVLTGVVLTLFFEPSTAERLYTGDYAPLDGARTSAAYASTVRLSYDVPTGLLIRQTHHWAALVFVAAIVLHLARIFFTGAFRKPREINWLVGVTMLTLALLNGFSGYSLPDDLLSGTGLRIIYSVLLSIPLVGEWLAFLAFGGEFPGDEIIPRLFITHVLLVPAALVVLVTVHLAVLVRQKHSQFPGPGRTESNVVGSRLWPGYTLRTLALFGWVLAVLFALGGLVQINPVWIYGPYDPAQATAPAQPDWYVAWGEGALRLFPAVEFTVFGHVVPSPFLPGVVLGGLTFAGLYAWPFLEAWRTRDHRPHQLLDRPREHPVRIGVGVGVLVFYSLLTVAAADDVIARPLRASVTDVVTALRALVLVLPVPAGVAAWLVARALRASGAGAVTALTRADLRASGSGSAGGDGGRTGEDRPKGHLELCEEADHTWRWAYHEPSADLRLIGNRVYRSREEALDAARTAYPDATALSVSPPSKEAVEEATREVSRKGRDAAGWLALLAIGAWRRRRRR